MSTPAQQTANEANAQLSTGPKTEAGKAASAANNFRHACLRALNAKTTNQEFENELLFISSVREATREMQAQDAAGARVCS